MACAYRCASNRGVLHYVSPVLKRLSAPATGTSSPIWRPCSNPGVLHYASPEPFALSPKITAEEVSIAAAAGLRRKDAERGVGETPTAGDDFELPPPLVDLEETQKENGHEEPNSEDGSCLDAEEYD